jgi:hypothetical protein
MALQSPALAQMISSGVTRTTQAVVPWVSAKSSLISYSSRLKKASDKALPYLFSRKCLESKKCYLMFSATYLEASLPPWPSKTPASKAYLPSGRLISSVI